MGSTTSSTHPQELRDRYGEIMFRFAFTSVFVDGVFSGDPHPGNYLFLDDGRVCFLDFGLVKRTTPEEFELLRAPMAALVSGDRALLRSSLTKLGALKPDADVDDELLWKVFVRILGPVDVDEPKRCTMERDGESDELAELPREQRREVGRQLDMPPAALFFMRYRRGMWSVLAHLGAEANWHRITREILFGDETVHGDRPRLGRCRRALGRRNDPQSVGSCRGRGSRRRAARLQVLILLAPARMRR